MGGRPRKYQTVEQLQSAVDSYFESTEKYTVTGLALHLGFKVPKIALKKSNILSNHVALLVQNTYYGTRMQESILRLNEQYAKAICNICELISLGHRHLHYRLHLAFCFLCSISFGGIYHR